LCESQLLGLASFVKTQWFGVSASTTVSVSIWLLTATVVHCYTVPDDALGSRFQCRQDSLASYLIVYERWPYQHAPLFGYWDSYDDKLAMLIEEPYSQLFLTVSMAYLIWFRIVVYAKNRLAREKKTASVNR
jgi:hypothetical protein